MNITTYASCEEDIARIAKAHGASEVLLEPLMLSRFGHLTRKEVENLARAAEAQSLERVLVWDALIPERNIDEMLKEIEKWDLSLFTAVRIQDPGAAQWLLTHRSDALLQLIVEVGSHNLEALQGWCECFGPRLQRLVLSIELPEEKLIEYCESLPCQVELLGAGPILLFHSPRALLSNRFSPPQPESIADNFRIEAISSSTESHDRLFPTIETAHGTFMFLDKDQFILDKLDKLLDAGLHTVRIDMRHTSTSGGFAELIVEVCDAMQLDSCADVRSIWPRVTRSPFFKSNKTTAQFAKLKSRIPQFRNENGLAEVVAAEKGECVVFFTRQAFDSSGDFLLVLPSGEDDLLIHGACFRDSSGAVIDRCEQDRIVVTQWYKKAALGALLRYPS
ncbi:MAG: U32 family peptidase [Bdellovibrionales bacterium]|nr:U32 family peptidase [Bdellovibrionales bacterium]